VVASCLSEIQTWGLVGCRTRHMLQAISDVIVLTLYNPIWESSRIHITHTVWVLALNGVIQIHH